MLPVDAFPPRSVVCSSAPGFSYRRDFQAAPGFSVAAAVDCSGVSLPSDLMLLPSVHLLLITTWHHTSHKIPGPSSRMVGNEHDPNGTDTEELEQ